MITVPELSLVVLVGVSGSGKTSFARKHFKPTQVLSSDFCRGLVADDEGDQSASRDAFDVLHYIARTRLRRGLLTVIDATSVQREARRALIELARAENVLVDAIVIDIPEKLAQERNLSRPDRDFGPHVIRRQAGDLRRSMKGIAREGFRRVHVLRGVDEVDAAQIGTEKAWSDKRELSGPFDIIGDVHGCYPELHSLLAKLGWQIAEDGSGAVHPQGRTAVFVGDLVDRGPDTPGVLKLAMGMVSTGNALCVMGNHEQKLVRSLSGRKVRISHGLQESLDQLAAQPAEFQQQALAFMDGLISHYQLDGGKLVVAHAGLKQEYHGRASGRVRSFALYGETTGETDEYGLPVRLPWANEYRGTAMVVYGHVATDEAVWVNNTICLDTGAVFGGKLTALRYPEREIVSEPARQTYYEPVRPLGKAAAQRDPEQLNIADVAGTRHIDVRFTQSRIKVQEENSAAALEIMSRFAVDPRWLWYLPPTMAPADTSSRDGYLEYPEEAFSEYAKSVERVVCEEKHMGSRAIVVLHPDSGACYTRTGRPFFAPDVTAKLLAELTTAFGPLMAELNTEWMVLDGELLPWSAKAGELIRTQYAAVGAAAEAALPAALGVLEQAAARGLPVAGLAKTTQTQLDNARLFRDAYRRYCWPTDGLDGVQFAPFQILAIAGQSAGLTQSHNWHLKKLAAVDHPLVKQTAHRFVDLSSAAERAEATDWWLRITAAGGEGMVVKPADIAPESFAGKPIQPGLKVRGREYLRIIYGPDYTESLETLRNRGLGRKRSLALREHTLGLEALARLADGEPLWRVHEPVFAVLALESEPVDPRL